MSVGHEHVPVVSMIVEGDIPEVECLLKTCGLSSGYLGLYWQHYFCVRIDGVMVGCSALIPKYPGVCEAKSICVAPSHRSTGIYDLLMNGLKTMALEHHARHLVLKVNRHNSARHSYAKRGFVELTSCEFPSEYEVLLKDCKLCHSVVQGICNPIYLFCDLRNETELKKVDLIKLNERGAQA